MISFSLAGHSIIGPTCVDDTWLDPTVSAPCGTFICPEGWTIENYGGNRCCCDPDDGAGGLH